MIDAVVTGRSLPALQTALDLAEVGLQVLVLDGEPGDTSVPWAERDPDGAIGAFAKRIAASLGHASEGAAAAALSELSVAPPLLFYRGRWLPQPEPNVLGVPAVPLVGEAISALGSGGAFRAYLDRLAPLLTVGKTRMLGALVQQRMGQKVRERLVDPQIFERFGADAAEVETATAVPGLNEALSRAGCLSAAVLAYADRNVARETRVTPALGAARFTDAVLRRLELYGVQLRPGRAASIVRQEAGWAIQLERAEVIEARSLVADVGESVVADEALRPYVQGALPRKARLHASTAIQKPDWLPDASRAIARGRVWAVAVDADLAAGQSRVADCAPGATQPTPEQTCAVQLRHRATEVSVQAALLAELQESTAGFAEAALTELGGGEWLRGAQLWRLGLRAAPFCALAERDRAAHELAACAAEQPHFAIVGRAVHGDDQAAALTSAHAAAVCLRRQLLGLTDEG